MAFFHSFTESLKQKWLQFFQVNRDWIALHMEVESVYTPDGGRRPPSYLILGVANAMEPKLAQLMLPFSRLNPDADTLIEVLDLHFDPDIALGNRVIPKMDTYGEESTDDGDENSNDETLTNHHTNGYGNAALDMDTDGETLMVTTPMIDEFTSENHIDETHNRIGEHSFSPNEAKQTSAPEGVDEFGDISFDDLKEGDTTTNAAVTSEDGDFSNVLKDVWGNEDASNKEEADADNDMFLGEDLTSGDLDDSEIASLFPNN
ncbi:MAG: DUF5331 domain-containing protein [Scytonema sp. PMC 1069.18]|nr:DUF5331 domain-containing protein [Scytonema sp. PMC 1069.18]MEC4879730.1 DUF5331 domain-containing protein [Scytonema sp. PMC 1070.18]